MNITKINADKIKQIGNQYSISKANPYSGLKIYNNVTSRIILSQKDSQLKHIFRETNGHLTDTIENRNLLEEVANNRNNFLGPDKHGNEWYGKMSSNGTQIWVEVRGKTIINGGINEIPKIYNPETGLSNYKKINIK